MEVHTDAPALDVVKAGQAVHAPAPAALKVLAGQVAHAVVLPWPKVPAGQVWQEVEVPGMKKVPAPQQTRAPLGEQCFVAPGHVPAQSEHSEMPAALYVGLRKVPGLQGHPDKPSLTPARIPACL